jgi:hypothetical protein
MTLRSFDSSSYSYRGGIWPDAGRRERPDVSNVSNAPTAVDGDAPTVSALPDVYTSPLTSGDPDSNVKRSNSEGDVDVKITGPQHTSPQPAYHAATLPRSRDPSPNPGPSHHSLANPRGHDLPVEEPDLPTETVLLETQRPPLRHKASSGSEKSKRRFLSLRRTSQSPSPGLGSHPSSREPSPTPSLENLRALSPEPMSRPPKSPVPSGQPSLLSTLKSRAGDRQALSNTARETVRKWTVNWGGLKRDRDSVAASPEDTRDPRVRSASQKVKSSYAEIRAAVDERRDKDRRSSEGSSVPIPIPDPGHRERADSMSSTHNAQPSSLSSSLAGSSLLPSSTGSAGRWADEVSPPEPSSMRPPAIDIDGMPLDEPPVDSQDVNGMGPVPVTVISPPTPLPPRPIQSQPSKGKTMTIPGIHVRHRGEVMSMGYVPPSPPAPETKAGVSSVYRLWKHSPAGQSEHGDGDVERASSHSPPVLSADSAETTPEPSPTITTRPQAPPLPARTPTLSHSVPSDTSSVSPASAALKSIVSRDEECRTHDGEGIEASNPPAAVGPKPPLPPRKIQLQASA